jgi:hypothetical protein
MESLLPLLFILLLAGIGVYLVISIFRFLLRKWVVGIGVLIILFYIFSNDLPANERVTGWFPLNVSINSLLLLLAAIGMFILLYTKRRFFFNILPKTNRPTPMNYTINATHQPGIYVARTRSTQLVPVTRDPRYVHNCARVNSSNVKLGKAKNLATRKKNYIKDFDASNIEFIPIAITQDYDRAETVILRTLKQYRKKSPKGRPMDWLENISLDQVIQSALQSMAKEEIAHKPLI